jgi:hypothetical protein
MHWISPRLTPLHVIAKEVRIRFCFVCQTKHSDCARWCARGQLVMGLSFDRLFFCFLGCLLLTHVHLLSGLLIGAIIDNVIKRCGCFCYWNGLTLVEVHEIRIYQCVCCSTRFALLARGRSVCIVPVLVAIPRSKRTNNPVPTCRPRYNGGHVAWLSTALSLEYNVIITIRSTSVHHLPIRNSLPAAHTTRHTIPTPRLLGTIKYQYQLTLSNCRKKSHLLPVHGSEPETLADTKRHRARNMRDSQARRHSRLRHQEQSLSSAWYVPWPKSHFASSWAWLWRTCSTSCHHPMLHFALLAPFTVGYWLMGRSSRFANRSQNRSRVLAEGSAWKGQSDVAVNQK